MNGCLVVGQRIGRLGNQIYLLAHLLALHQANGICFAHPALGTYGQFFQGTCSDPLARYPAPGGSVLARFIPRSACYYGIRLLDKTKIIGRPGCTNFLRADYREVVDLADTAFLERVRKHSRFWLLGGWLFRYPTITKEFLPAARRFFALCEPYTSRVSKLVSQARQGNDILVGVHIRQTDFKEHSGGKYYFTTEQYAEVMQRTSALFQDRSLRFLVVSDEPKTLSDFPGLRCAFGTSSPVEDMYALGSCDYIISSYGSSFSAWPSFLYERPAYRIQDAGHQLTLDDFQYNTDPWQMV